MSLGVYVLQALGEERNRRYAWEKKGWGRAGEEGNFVEKNIIESEDTSLGPAEGAEE